MAAAGAGLSFLSTQAAEDGRIGKMELAEFKETNANAGAKVKALTASSEPLSDQDLQLMLLVATGGMLQLEASKTAATNSSHKDVRVIAQAEVEEQTVLGAKLKEFATAKKVKLPDEPDKETAQKLKKLRSHSGTDFDRAYLQEIGVKGHERLQATMNRVQAEAEDADLKKLAITALPLIGIHLQVAVDEHSMLT